MQNKELEKRNAGRKAVEFIKDGMIVGLGTGSTVYYSLERIGELVKSGYNIHGVSTSTSTTEVANFFGIPLLDVNEINKIDLTIDGANEFDLNFNAVKGGGGALLFEKIVASMSDQIIYIIDSSKLVNKIGKFPIALEVIPYGYKKLLQLLYAKGMEPYLRVDNKIPYRTDSNNYIIDLYLSNIKEPRNLRDFLKGLTGVVEVGLFINVPDLVIVGKGDGTENLRFNNIVQSKETVLMT